jgi:hypothetical protein
MINDRIENCVTLAVKYGNLNQEYTHSELGVNPEYPLAPTKSSAKVLPLSRQSDLGTDDSFNHHLRSRSIEVRVGFEFRVFQISLVLMPNAILAARESGGGAQRTDALIAIHWLFELPAGHIGYPDAVAACRLQH